MPITLPAAVAPNELIQSAWGNAVVAALDELDDEKLDLAGGTMTGMLVLPATTPTLSNHATRKGYVDAEILAAPYVETAGDIMTGQLLINAGAGAVPLILRRSTQDPMVDLQSTTGTRFGYLQGTSGGVTLQSEADISFFTNNSQRARMVGTAFLIGKAASDLDVSGVELFMIGSSVKGSVRSTTDISTIQNWYARHMSGADAGGEDFAQFARTSAGTVIGSISQVSTTGVAYNTTSDERLKTVLRELDDDEIATILRLVAPVVFEFDSDPGNEHVGFIAQQLAAAWPTFVDVGIVTPGRGKPEDALEYREISETRDSVRPVLDEAGEPVLDDKGNHVTEVVQVIDTWTEPVPGTGFEPWMVDLSKLVPLLVAGWQQLDRRLALVEAG